MTGHSTLLVELDDGTGTFPYDVTAWVNLRYGWSLSRGRRDEFADIDPAVLRLQFDNTDGRFTLGSPLYGIRVDQQIRVTETFGATTSARHTGYVQDWPTMWDSPTAVRATMRVTSTDRQARLQRRDAKPFWYSEAISRGARLIYTLGEDQGATSAGDTAGASDFPINIFGTGPAPTFGNPGPGDATVATFSGGVEGQYLRRFRGISLTRDMGRTFECLVRSTEVGTSATEGTDAWLVGFGSDPAVGHVFGIGVTDLYESVQASASSVHGNAAAGIGGTDPPVNDGEWHHVAGTYTPLTDYSGTWRIYQDGELLATGTQNFINVTDETLDSDRLTVGRNLNGDMGNVAVYESVLDDEAIATLAALSLYGVNESSDVRVSRLAQYAGVDPADMILESGLLAEVPAQSLDGKVWPAIQDVATAEGGSVFVDGMGRLVMHNRRHRTLAGAQPPVVTLQASDIDDDVQIPADKQYLQNRVTGSRVNGATQVAESADSLALYDEYPETLTGLLVTTDAEVLDRLNWQVTAYDEPLPRMSSVTIDLLTLTDDAKVEALLALELGDRILITDLPPQSPMSQADLIVEGIEEKQSVTEWSLTLNTVRSDLFRAWVLGDATYGVLGSTTRLHY